MILLFIEDVVMAIGVYPEQGDWSYFHEFATEFEHTQYSWIKATYGEV